MRGGSKGEEGRAKSPLFYADTLKLNLGRAKKKAGRNGPFDWDSSILLVL